MDTLKELCVCTEGHFTQIRANDNCEWETQNSTPLYHIALALYRLADHEHEVIGSTPEADGIALLYSNPQGRGRCVLSMPFLLYSPFISVHSRLFRNLLLSKCAALPISFNQHLSPAFSFPSISLPVSSTSPSPPIPCGSAGYTPHSKTENHVTGSGSIRVHLLPGTVLYNDTYITCLQQWQSAILALYNTTALLKRKRKKNPDANQAAEEPALRFPAAHEVVAHGIQ